MNARLMCAIGKCRGVWVAIHGTNHRILAVGGRGKLGRQTALAEARRRQAKYGPPGPIREAPPGVVVCEPMLTRGPSARDIRRQLRELGAA